MKKGTMNMRTEKRLLKRILKRLFTENKPDRARSGCGGWPNGRYLPLEEVNQPKYAALSMKIIVTIIREGS